MIAEAGLAALWLAAALAALQLALALGAGGAQGRQLGTIRAVAIGQGLLTLFAFGALVALSAMTALAVFAFSQRSQARDQARSARSGQLVASGKVLYLVRSCRSSCPSTRRALTIQRTARRASP